MFDKTQMAADAPDRRPLDAGSAAGRITLPSDALTRALDRARTLAATWRGRGARIERPRRSTTANQSPTPWLLTVPDVGPACEMLLADRLFHDLAPAEREGLAEWIRERQDTDSGAWLDARGRPDLSLTALGWWACKVAGDDASTDRMTRAVRVVHALGGAQRAHFSVRLWLAMGGQIPWSWLPAIPSELFLLPPSVPLSPARFSPWARGMLIPYQLIARAPARLQLPDAEALLLKRNDGTPVVPRLTRPGLAGDLLQAFDRTVKLSRKLPRGPLPGAAAQRALQWIDAHQQGHGGWFSVRPTLLSLVALRVAGAASDDPRIRRGLDYLRAARGLVRDGDTPDDEVHPIYRIHDPPRPERVAALERLLASLAEVHGLDPQTWTWSRREGKSLSRFLAALPTRGPHARIAQAIQRQAIMINMRSVFSPEPGRHHGVGAEVYARFSAPMREIVGIFLHKELWEKLGQVRPGSDDEQLRTQIVQRANEAKLLQRELTRAANLLVLDQLFGRDVAKAPEERKARTGTVMGITRTKLHIRLDDPAIDVKVYARHVPGGWQTDEEGTWARRGEKLFELGSAVQIAVGERDAQGRWKLDFDQVR